MATQANSIATNSNIVLSPDVVYPVGVVYDAGVATVYVNGVAGSPSSATGVGLGVTRFFASSLTAPWKGRIREMIVLKRAPTDEDLAAIRSNLGT
jgi:hypothetical protein